MKQTALTIWDSRSSSQETNGIVYLWNGYTETDTIRSLLRYIENHGERLRAKYLSWIHDLGESRIDGKCIIDHLAFNDGLSYWWMTLFVEKSCWKSPSIAETIRLFALEEIVLEQKPCKIKLVSADKSKHEVIKNLCHSLKIEYEWTRLSNKERQFSLKSLYHSLPQPVQAILGFTRHLLIRWPLKKAQKSNWFYGSKTLFFCSYFIHLDQYSCSDGRFYSRHWEILPKMLHDNGFRINWLQHYQKSSIVPNTRIALNWVKQFNQNRQEQGFHTFLDAFLSWCIIWIVLKKWLILIRAARRMRGLQTAFHPRDSKLFLWPVMKREWRIIIYGHIALENLLWIELFDAALKDIPHQEKGLYLCENQGWERAFIHMWRKHKHGKLIAVTHSTVRFWDLRYFTDPRTIESHNSNPIPKPDITTLNGKPAIAVFCEAGQPMNRTVECEALRYIYLNGADYRKYSFPASERNIKVLVLGDFMADATMQMLKLLAAADQLLPDSFNYTIKPHPNHMIQLDKISNTKMKIVSDPLGKIMKHYDFAFTSSTTSAAVDAYLNGLPVVVMLDNKELNMSPLRAQPGVHFVSTHEELAKALLCINHYTNDSSLRNEFFFLDSDLPRWRKLLGLNPIGV